MKIVQLRPEQRGREDSERDVKAERGSQEVWRKNWEEIYSLKERRREPVAIYTHSCTPRPCSHQ